MASAPSRVSKPAAKSAMPAEAMEPEVGTTSMNGLKIVSHRIRISGSKSHGRWNRKVSRA